MERLTKRNKSRAECNVGYCPEDCNFCQMNKDISNKLADYEDAEEQGLLLRLPCKVGDTVYALTPFCEICEEALDNTYACENCSKGDFVAETKFDYEMIHKLGKRIFLTKEEAEQKLAEMRGE